MMIRYKTITDIVKFNSESCRNYEAKFEFYSGPFLYEWDIVRIINIDNHRELKMSFITDDIKQRIYSICF